MPGPPGQRRPQERPSKHPRPSRVPLTSRPARDKIPPPSACEGCCPSRRRACGEQREARPVVDPADDPLSPSPFSCRRKTDSSLLPASSPRADSSILRTAPHVASGYLVLSFGKTRGPVSHPRFLSVLILPCVTFQVVHHRTPGNMWILSFLLIQGPQRGMGSDGGDFTHEYKPHTRKISCQMVAMCITPLHHWGTTICHEIFDACGG